MTRLRSCKISCSDYYLRDDSKTSRLGKWDSIASTANHCRIYNVYYNTQGRICTVIPINQYQFNKNTRLQIEILMPNPEVILAKTIHSFFYDGLFIQWLAYIKYEWFLQDLEMACVFVIKISIYKVCYQQYMFTRSSNQ